MLKLKEILYCLAISLQLSGALLIIYNSYNNLSRSNLIKNFLKNSFTKQIQKEDSEIKKKDILIYSHEAFLDFIHLQYKNFASFICIFVGYILGVLGEIQNKMLGIIIIVIFTPFIILIINKIIDNKTKNIKEIETEELKNLNIDPSMKATPPEKIIDLFR